MALAVMLLMRAYRKGFSILITDHLVMLTTSFSLYFLFGASFLVFGNPHEVDRAMSYYPVNALDALRGDAVNGIGFGTALVLAAMAPRGWFFRSTSRAALQLARVRTGLVLVITLALGVGAYGYTLLYDFGFRTGVVPGIFRVLALFCVVGVFLAASARGRHRRKLHIFAAFLSIALAASGVLLFNKTQILLSTGALVAGYAMVYRPKLVLALGIPLIAATYIGTSDMVLFGRNMLGPEQGVSLEVRAFLALEGLERSGEDDPVLKASPWGRLSYVNAQGAGMALYDKGQGGDDFTLLPWLFAPRFLFPDKPILSQTSADFHEKITGNEGSSTGQGVFSAGYYSGGWPGVIAAAVITGIALAETSAVATAVITTGAALLLPLALIGLYIAFRIDGSFLLDVAGPFTVVLYVTLLMALTPSRRGAPTQMRH